jgi:hypothetical protein
MEKLAAAIQERYSDELLEAGLARWFDEQGVDLE